MISRNLCPEYLIKIKILNAKLFKYALQKISESFQFKGLYNRNTSDHSNINAHAQATIHQAMQKRQMLIATISGHSNTKTRAKKHQ